jgi:hypothetical protein
MGNATRCIEVMTGEGKLIFSLNLIEKEIEMEKKTESPAPRNPEPKSERSQSTNSKNADSMMTDAQKRYLFRILADQGIEGDRAYRYLKESFGVEVLKDVTKPDASRMIKQLLGEAQGGDGDGPPF